MKVQILKHPSILLATMVIFDKFSRLLGLCLPNPKLVCKIFSHPNPHIYLSMKEGSLFVFVCFVCTYEIHQTGIFHITFLVSLERSRGEGVHGLHCMTLGIGIAKFLNIEIFFTENFGGIGMCLWRCWKDLDEQDF
jgi:hypothetical protein